MLLVPALLLVARVIRADVGCGTRPAFEGKTRYSRIIAGLEAEVGEFPWQVSIQAQNEHYCGGAILSPWWILTAAHCMDSDEVLPRDLSVVVGTNDLSSSSVEIKAVTHMVHYKDFKRENMNNDIALLLLASPIKFSDLKVPICLPPQPAPSSWHECWVAGWGQTNPGETGITKSELMKVPMVITDWKECAQIFPKLTKNMLCAGFENESYDACQGDSGGPLVCTPEPGGKWYQVGIISWGRSCGQKNTPGIYTVLANYIPWMEKVTRREGRPLGAETMRPPPEEKDPGRSQAPEGPAPAHPWHRLLSCLLSCVLLRAIITWE